MNVNQENVGRQGAVDVQGCAIGGECKVLGAAVRCYGSLSEAAYDIFLRSIVL